MKRFRQALAGAALAATLSACATAEALKPPAPPDPFLQMMGQLPEPRLSQAMAAADAHPLGSARNPVRADMPQGQRAYLSRLRCENGSAPAFSRDGSVGPGPFGSIVDRYTVTCPGSAPAQANVFMDMYFPGHVESRAVAGFGIAP